MIRLLPPSSSATPLTSPVTWRTRLHAWAVESAHRLLNELGVPGAIRDLEYHDKANGCTIRVRVGVYYTVLTIDGRDYYFHRITGRLDGTGQAV